MKGSNFKFDYVHLLYYKFHEINFKWGIPNIDSPDGIIFQLKIFQHY